MFNYKRHRETSHFYPIHQTAHNFNCYFAKITPLHMFASPIFIPGLHHTCRLTSRRVIWWITHFTESPFAFLGIKKKKILLLILGVDGSTRDLDRILLFVEQTITNGAIVWFVAVEPIV